MSDTLADLTTSLSPEFLTAGDMNHKPLFFHHHHHHHHPYDFNSSSSTESESDDDDIAGLTRRFTRSLSLQDRLKIPLHLEKTSVFSGSPEMTFGRNVSGGARVRSSPATPFAPAEEDYRDLVYAAAGEIARMKMKMKMNSVNDAVLATGGLIGASRLPGAPLSHHHNHHLPNCENEVFLRQRQFRRRVAGGVNSDCGGRCRTAVPAVLRPPAWPPLLVETQCRQPQPPPPTGFAGKPAHGGCGRRIAVVKKERAGTGVFLPRSYCNLPPESKKTPACSPTHLTAGLPHSFNKYMDPIINQPPPPPSQSNINGGFAPQYQLPPSQHHFKRDELAELLMARRTAVMLAQQRRSTANVAVAEKRTGPPEVVLPQEWTY